MPPPLGAARGYRSIIRPAGPRIFEGLVDEVEKRNMPVFVRAREHIFREVSAAKTENLLVVFSDFSYCLLTGRSRCGVCFGVLAVAAGETE